ncbi:hypothetical protein [Sphingomonas nostoxanthinifaciens]|uniref:hypothetical protein n=1 Tax=Sphingomonas nostoxanthinifaciens TaxID=2872652 RepID=UPI001CC1C9FE|nr:hypothetical protein [Sphingomonas nostoxanthinifaciens]UAK25853.1 hypothetical protein K8P63_06940 [Sphingomonas nostoxanthinifaciens]
MNTKGIRGALKGQTKPRGGKAVERVETPADEPMQEPTDEQQARYSFSRGQIRDEGIKIGFAYRRVPLVESLAKKIGLSTTDLIALRYYRNAYERADSSPTKSCLDVGAGGGGGNGTESRAMAAIERGLSARLIVDRCETAIGRHVGTFRAVAVFDRSFSNIAMDRFGSRKQSWLVDETPAGPNGIPPARKVFREKLVPISGRHRQIVADEFMSSLRGLTALVSGYRGTAGTGNVSERPVMSIARNPVSSAIAAAIMRTPAPAGIWVAEATLGDVAREHGAEPEDLAELHGVPLMVRPDWIWGWLLCVAEEESCAGATEVA